MTTIRALVAGVGNALYGDDGFGDEVVRRLAGRLPDDVALRSFGIRAFDLASALMDGVPEAILIDAMRRGGAPGTLYLIEPTVDEVGTRTPSPHALDPVQVLAMVRASTGRLPRLRVLGCEPALVDEMTIGLSAPVEAAVGPACRMIEELLGGAG
ncbi:MAG: hydrogenase maturation protease [Sandaracinaceae bacterium]